MRAWGAAIAADLRAGDVVVLLGPLGAGKTTLTQGIAQGLGVQDAVTSPTFVIAREHHSEGGPDLVHVDAYRLSGALELDDVDLEASLADAVTVVEWGSGMVEHLDAPMIRISITRPDERHALLEADDTASSPRVVSITWPEGRP